MKPQMAEKTPVLSSSRYFRGLGQLLARTDTSVVDQIADAIWQIYKQERTVYLFGNGADAALASHFACDLAKGTIVGDHRRLRAVALSDNIPLLTAWANDSHYDEVFAEQLRNLVEAGDLVLAISASGYSRNVLRGLEVAREAGAKVVALTGYEGGRLRDRCDVCLVVPSDNIQQTEDVHLSASHAIYTALRRRMMQQEGE
jgi:D-sedoheptulose 7-phosphate isomerase